MSNERRWMLAALLTAAILVVYAAMLFYQRHRTSVTVEGTPSCSSFTSQYLAQQAFDSDRARFANLDKNRNQVACETLP